MLSVVVQPFVQPDVVESVVVAAFCGEASHGAACCGVACYGAVCCGHPVMLEPVLM